MAKFVNDDGVFEAGFEQALPETVRDYAKQFKTLGDALEAGRKNQQEFRSRVKIPEDEAGKRALLKEHFQPLLEADAAAAKKKQEEEAAKAQADAEASAAKANQENLEKAQANVKALIGGPDGKEFDVNMELARRAMRSEHMPQQVKDLLAATVGAESFAKVTDEQIKAVLGRDPVMAQMAVSMGKLASDGRSETGDGHTNRTGEKEPAYPHNPEYYKGQPDTDPEKVYFINRGAKYEGGQYRGGYAVTKQ